MTRGRKGLQGNASGFAPGFVGVSTLDAIRAAEWLMFLKVFSVSSQKSSHIKVTAFHVRTTEVGLLWRNIPYVGFVAPTTLCLLWSK